MTSPTGTERQSLVRTGFSLLELVAVLALLTVMTTIGLGRQASMRHGREVDQGILLVRDQVLLARTLAVRHQQAVRLRLDLDAGTASLAMIDPTTGPRPMAGNAAPSTSWLPPERRQQSRFIDAAGSHYDTGVVDLVFLPDRRCLRPGRLHLQIDDTVRTLTIPAGLRQPTLHHRTAGQDDR